MTIPPPAPTAAPIEPAAGCQVPFCEKRTGPPVICPAHGREFPPRVRRLFTKRQATSAWVWAYATRFAIERAAGIG